MTTERERALRRKDASHGLGVYSRGAGKRARRREREEAFERERAEQHGKEEGAAEALFSLLPEDLRSRDMSEFCREIVRQRLYEV